METIVAVSPGHCLDPQIAIAATKAGGLGILDLGYVADGAAIGAAIDRLRQKAGTAGRWGVRWDTLGVKSRGLDRIVEYLPQHVPVLVLAGLERHELAALRPLAARSAHQVFVEVRDLESALAAQAAGYAGLIVKGHEASGWIGKSSSYILLQELRGRLDIPYWIQGGIGMHSAAAAALAGATGVVLAEQLWLTAEGPFSSPAQRALWNRLDGSEAIAVGQDCELYRLSNRHGRAKLRELELAVASNGAWRELLEAQLRDNADPLVPLGQDIAFAAGFAERYGTTGRVITALGNAMDLSPTRATTENHLAPDSPLAKLHGTRFPIVQGPMTRVSDVASFAQAVADGGALPFLALAVMRGPQVHKLLYNVKETMGERPWGVGILGFLPLDLRQEQMEIVTEVKPPFAIVAGGRPSQARELEALGISTYLHVPSPGLLREFVKEGARKFIFEGSECGGHTGPRTSFVLWGSAIETLTSADIKDPENVQVLFAGGIHDALSAAMVSMIAAPLCARGMKVGVLMGTAYLFTEEAVRAGAIVKEFQDQAIACRETAVLQSGVGIFTRCAKTAFCDEFDNARRQLLLDAKPDDQILMQLEMMNIGRLRIASKGVSRNTDAKADDPGDRYVGVDVETQRREGLYMMGEVARLRARAVTIAALHEAVSAGPAAILAEAEPAHPLVTPPEPREPIAIVGMAALLPGANDLRTYWQNIMLSVDAVREVPHERWRPEDFYDPKRGTQDKVYSKWGGFLDDIAFDPSEYGIPPTSLRSIDAGQLLALHVTRKALEDAGFDKRPFPRERTATIFAVGGVSDLGMDYVFRTLLAHYLPKAEGISDETRKRVLDSLYEHALPKWTGDSFPGTLDNVVAGRVANRLDLRGANFVVDAACAGSLAALDTGMLKLRSGEADVAVVGAVDGTNSAPGFMSFAQTHALSPRGRCRPFDDSADGIAIGEGVAVVVLKRLADAERDGDRIYAVIKGLGASSDGHNRSMTAPHPQGQVLAIERACADAGVDPTTVGLIEAHGTGTAVGDKSEIKALNLAYATADTPRQRCAVGSVKSMIGHTKSTAGLASLIKASLALQHRVLPPTLGVEKPNSSIDLARTPFYLNTETRPWFAGPDTQPRRCGISAFGFGGTNFHTILEEYRGGYRSTDSLDLNPRSAEIFAFTRADRAEIEAAARTLLEGLAHREHLDLAQLAYSVRLAEAKVRPNNGMPFCHLAVVATSVADLEIKLQRFLNEYSGKADIRAPQGIYYRELPHREDSGAVCMLFPGQGSQRLDMLRDLVVANPSVHTIFERADALLEGSLDQPLSRYIYPLPSFTREERERRQAELNDTHVAQPALGVVDLAAFDILTAFGLKPNFVAGHSYGEFVAACAAGVISRDELVRLSEVRGRIAAEASKARSGTMAAVNADESKVAETITRLGLAVSIANLNAPEQTIIAGSVEAIEAAIQAFTAEHVRVKALPVTAAFHCGAMSAAKDTLAAELARIECRQPRIGLFSNTTGTRYPDDPHEIRALLARHIAEPLRFVDEIRGLYGAGARVFVEVGPGTVLSGLVDRILGQKPHLTLAIDSQDRAGWLQLAHLLAQAFVLGLPVDLEPWFARRGLAEVTLPQVFEEARSRSIVGPMVWRVNAARAIPWHAQSREPKPDVRASDAQIGAPTKATTDRVTAAVVTDAATPAERSKPSTKAEGRLAVSIRDPLPTPKAPAARAFASGDDSRFNHIQGSLSQLIDLQREQQETLQRFFVFQEQWVRRNDNGAIEAAAMNVPEEGATQSPPAGVPAPILVPPAPVLPKFATAPDENPIARQHAASTTPPPAPERVAPPMRPAASAAKAGTKPAAAAGAPKLAPTETFKADLLRTVAERTGYTEDMLDLDALMEADLGIDSIKRIEIFSKLKDQYSFMEGRSEEEVFEELAGLKTLNAIVEWYDRQRGDVAKTGGTEPGKKSLTPPLPSLPEAVESKKTKASPDEVQRYAVAPVAAPRELRAGTAGFPTDRLVLLVGDAPILSAAFRDALTRMHHRVQQVVAGTETRVLDEDRLEVDFSSLEAVEKLQALLASLGHEVGAVLNLSGLEPIEDMAKGRHLDYARRLFLLLKALEKDLKVHAPPGGAWLINLTALDGQFGLGKAHRFSEVHAGTLGVAKSAAQEWPGLRVKCIDVDPEIDPSQLVREVLHEVASGDPTTEVGFTREDRWTLDLRSGGAGAVDLSGLDLGSESVLLVTGGAYGITADVTRALAEKYRPRLVLVGRSHMPEVEDEETRDLAEPHELKQYLIRTMRAQNPKTTPAMIDRALGRLLKDRRIRANIAAMRAAGAEVEYHALDIRDEDAFGRLIDAIYARRGRIDGVIHGAGMIEDKLIRDKSPESFDAVFGTKVAPAIVLARKLRPEGLKFLLFFSSVVGRFGNAGQCDYAAANEVLNKLAGRLSREWPRVHTLAINWGPWDGGMVSDELRRLYATKGIYTVPVEKGKQQCLEELGRRDDGEPEIVVAASLQQLAQLALRRAVDPQGEPAADVETGTTRQPDRTVRETV